MKSLKILITAGPTREPIDPVRFITNHSTGAMGYSIARLAHKSGYQVTLISGPTHLKPPAGVKTIYVDTAQEMFHQVKKHFKPHNCLVMAAAVSDFHPAYYNRQKIKTATRLLSIKLCKNPDILAWAGKNKEKRIVVGFCMETENLLNRAREKRNAKNIDIIVANRITKFSPPFGRGPTNVIMLDEGRVVRLTSVSKQKVAGILLDKIEKLWYKKHPE